MASLKHRIDELLPFVTDPIYYSHAHVRIEYGLKLNNQLQGSLDYYLENDDTDFPQEITLMRLIEGQNF